MIKLNFKMFIEKVNSANELSIKDNEIIDALPLKSDDDMKIIADYLDGSIKAMTELIECKKAKKAIKDSQELLEYKYDYYSKGNLLKEKGTFIWDVQKRLKAGETKTEILYDLIQTQ